MLKTTPTHCPDAEVIIRLAGLVLEEALALGLSDGNHRGGYLCIADNMTGESLDVAKLGAPEPAKKGQYEMLAKEKAWRLAGHPEHGTSYQSRDPARDLWGGAVRAGSHILAFSGLPEHLDEALMLVVARAYLGWMDADVVHRCATMAELSGNELYGRLHVDLSQQVRFALLGGKRVSA